MKKKIKDLTLEELSNKCAIGSCRDCPFYFEVDCYKPHWYLLKHIDLESEVEVDA